MEYDVFISCKSEDYKYAEEIYQFLSNNGVNTFLASKELRKLGESEYRKAIMTALESTYHMIVFASNAEYITSDWVYYEWDTFINARLKGFKLGQIVTILKDVPTGKIKMDLWKYESFTFENYKEKILTYIETPAYLKRKEEAEQQKAEEMRLQEMQAREEEERQKAKDYVISIAEEYKSKTAEWESVMIPKLLSAFKAAKITHRICPICASQINISDKFCTTCCWQISPLDGIGYINYLTLDNSNILSLARERYKCSDISEEKSRMQDIINNLKHECSQLRGLIYIKDQQIAKFEKSLEDVNVTQMLHNIKILEAKNLTLEAEKQEQLDKISRLEVEGNGLDSKYQAKIIELRNQCAQYKRIVAEKDEIIRSNTDTIKRLQSRSNTLSEQLNTANAKIFHLEKHYNELNSKHQTTTLNLRNQCAQLERVVEEKQKHIKDLQDKNNKQQNIIAQQARSNGDFSNPDGITDFKIFNLIRKTSTSSLLKSPNCYIKNYYDSSLKSLGFDYNQFISLFKREFNISLQSEFVRRCTTVRDLLNYVCSRLYY